MNEVKPTLFIRNMIKQLYDWVESGTAGCPICGDPCHTAVKDGNSITYLHIEHDNCVTRI